MKKLSTGHLQSRLKLDRQTVRVLNADQLPRVQGGNDMNTSSPRCSDNVQCPGARFAPAGER